MIEDFEKRIRTAGGAEALHAIAEDVIAAAFIGDLTREQRALLQNVYEARCAELWPRQCGRRRA